MKLATAVSWAIGTQYLIFAVQAAASMYLSRHFISPDEFGAFAIAVAAAGMVSSFQDFGLIRYLVGLKHIRREDLNAAFRISAALACAVCSLCLLAAAPVADWMEIPSVRTPLTLLGLAALFLPISLGPIVLLQRAMNFRALGFVESAGVLANAAISIYLAQAAFGAEALAWGSLAQQVARALCAQVMVKGHWPLQGMPSDTGALIRFGWNAATMNSLWLAANSIPDLMIGHHLGQTAAGLSSRAQGLSSLLRQLLSNAASPAFYAAFSKAYRNDEPLAPLYEHMVAGYCALAWPALAGTAILAEPVILLLFGENWLSVAPVLQWTALAQMWFIAVPLHVELPMLTGQTQPMVRRSIGDSTIFLIMVAMGAFHSVVAAAVMRFLFGFIWMAIHGPPIYALVGISFRRVAVLYGQALALTLAAILPAALARLFLPTGDLTPLVAMALACMGCILWLATIFATRHPAAAIIRNQLTGAGLWKPSANVR